ncbi:MAG: hypothetical protein E7360_05670 [Clostridiales bacterium]|nr:hypothetical protein [Clostridiales bacterium]
MKKLLAIILSVVTCFACLSLVSSCGNNSKFVGTYEMVSITGTMTYNGQTTQLDESLYEYYRITLNKDGTALVESKGNNTTSKIENEGTWEYKNNKVRLKSTQAGITVVEEMDWEDGVITYVANQSGQGMEISMNLVLEKVEE